MIRARFSGWLGERMAANLEQWLIPAPLANPGMTEMFLRRERQPREKLMPWYGEFPGKYLTSAAGAYACDPDARLYETCEALVQRLSEAQDECGYLSPHPYGERLIGTVEGNPEGHLWDLWGHYHVMLGLLRWHDVSGSALSWRVMERAADYVADALNAGWATFEKAGDPSMNLAVGHIFGILYRRTGKPSYRDAMKIALAAMDEMGRFVSGPLEGKEYFELPLPRWECLHSVQTLAEEARISGDPRARKAFFAIVESIRKCDRHNTGAFSSGEKACGDPYDRGAIETCCTVAWMALLTDALELSGEAQYADELELSLYNAMFGAQHPSGRWWTYDTPMDGYRRASAHTIVFQSYQGSPELNCCSVNGPRTLPMTAEWGAIARENAIDLNFLGAADWRVPLNGRDVNLICAGDYPVSPDVSVRVEVSAPARFALRVRVPSWSENTFAVLDGETLPAVAGEYLTVEREWRGGETLSLRLDFTPHAWRGSGACEGFSSVYIGPLLLAYDQRFNAREPEDMPEIDEAALEHIKAPAFLPPRLLLRDRASGATLCDFASAGAVGSRYMSWLRLSRPIASRGAYAIAP